jgi:small subunit ribosomal protein S7e
MSRSSKPDTNYYAKKIYKANNAAITELEESVARAFVELEVTSKDLSGDLRDLFITSAKEIESSNGKKAVIIFVPYRLHKRFQKIQSRLIRELEKKFSGKHVCFVAQRTILSTNYQRQYPGQMRPRSRTLTSVHNDILEDIVYPTQIVGKRVRVRTDNSKLLKVYLDPKDVKEVDYKLKTFSSVYKKLTNKNVEFLFPSQDE